MMFEIDVTCESTIHGGKMSKNSVVETTVQPSGQAPQAQEQDRLKMQKAETGRPAGTQTACASCCLKTTAIRAAADFVIWSWPIPNTTAPAAKKDFNADMTTLTPPKAR